MELLSTITKLRFLLREEGFAGLLAKISDKLRDRREERRYQRWIKREQLDSGRYREILEWVTQLPQTPMISVLLPVYNTDERLLRLCIESVTSQLYPHWQLCIADDASTAKHIRPILEKYAAQDERVKLIFRETNGHISAASNSALELASGEFTALLDHDDELSVDALFWIAKEISDQPDAELIYSDEDLIDEDGRRSHPRFKPDWSPDLFLSLNLLNHLVAFRTSTLRKIRGFREGFEGSQDYDLEFRFIEQIPEAAVRHIPRVLYHWRAIKGSVALSGGEKPYAHERARVAIREHLQRTGSPADVTGAIYDLHRVRLHLPVKLAKVSLIFIDDDSTDLIGRIDETIENTDYANTEVLVVTNGLRIPDEGHIRWIEQKTSSLAAAFNLAASLGTGELLCFADPNFRPLSANWLAEMVGWATRERVGAVGAKLLNQNWTVMYGGLLTGVEKVVGIAHQGVGRGALGNMFRNLFPGNFSATSVCFMVVGKGKFDVAGGFDAESFPNHLFDVDLSLRLRGAGMRIVVTPAAELIQTTNTGPAILTQAPSAMEVGNFRKKWPDHLLSDPFYNPNLSSMRGDFSIDI